MTWMGPGRRGRRVLPSWRVCGSVRRPWTRTRREPYSGSLTLHSREGGRRSEVMTGYGRRARRADAAVEGWTICGTGLLGAHVDVERGRGVQQRRERRAWQVGGFGSADVERRSAAAG